jgi:hypothetical protein
MTDIIINNNTITKKEFWHSSFSNLHIEDVTFINENKNFEVTQIFKKILKEKIRKEGYFQIDPPDWEAINIPQMAEAVSELVKLGFPPPMAFLFDEFWVIFRKLNNIAVSVLGEGYLRLPDFWAWHVDPQKQQSGWKPHRDKNFNSLNPDGSPKSITFWIPLSISTPLNGCMYIVPANKDRTYGTENDSKWDFDLPSIRALPAAAGTIFCWNQAVLHWGSQCSESEKIPRISVAFEFQTGDVAPYNQPVTDPQTIPTFDFRLKLIAKQILQYQHMYPLSDNLKAFAHAILKSDS